MIFNHCHVYPKGLWELLYDIYKQVAGPDAPYMDEKDWPLQGTIMDLRKQMKELGAEKAIVFALFDHILSLEDSLGPEFDANKWLLSNIKSEKDLFGFAVINPIERHAGEKLEKCISEGFVGAKVHPPVQQVQINDPSAEDFYRAAEDLRIPLLFHTGVHGWYLDKYRPILLDEVSKNHPKLPIIIEHVGGFALFNEALAVLENNENCYAGIAQTRKQENLWYLSPERMKILLDKIGSGRIIYGTDFPWNNQIKSDIEAINNLDISSGDKEKILGENIRNLIRSTKSPRAKEC